MSEAITRRALLAASLGVLGAKSAEASPSWANAQTEEASFVHPADWSVDQVLVPELIQPEQVFALRSGIAVPSNGDSLPNLDGYDAAGIVVWLLRYPHTRKDPPFVGILPDSLEAMPAEFGPFHSFGAWFATATSSYAIRVWVGRRASAETIAALHGMLASLTIAERTR